MILKVNTDTPSIVHLRCQDQKITTDLPLEDTAGMLVCVLIARFFFICNYRFNSATWYWSICAKPGQWVTCMCVRDIDFTTEFWNFSNGVVFFCYIIFFFYHYKYIKQRPSWSWSYGSWIYNYICNQCLSPLTLRVRIPLRKGVLDTTLCDKVCQWLEACLWFFFGYPGFFHQ